MNRGGRVHNAKSKTTKEEGRREQEQENASHESQRSPGKASTKTDRDRKTTRTDLKVRIAAGSTGFYATRLKNPCLQVFYSAILCCLPARVDLTSVSGLEESPMTSIKFGNDSTRLLRGEILRRWNQLTASDIEQCAMDRRGLTELLQNRYGFVKRRAEKEVELFFWEFQNRLRMAA
jgi:hypothetical protein